MSSKLNSDVRYAYMRGGATWKCLRVKADTVLFAGNTVSSISERIRNVLEDALHKSTLPLPLRVCTLNMTHHSSQYTNVLVVNIYNCILK